MKADDLEKELNDFKEEIEDRLKCVELLSKNLKNLERKNLQDTLRVVIRAEEREKQLIQIKFSIIIFGVINILLVGFALYTMWFTVPI